MGSDPVVALDFFPQARKKLLIRCGVLSIHVVPLELTYFKEFQEIEV